MKSEFLNEAKARGFFHQCTHEEELDDLMNQESITAYIGFDLTAPSLHVGNLVGIMLARLLQRCGHRPLILMGGATTRIGDPSGKDEMRRILTDEDIANHLHTIKQVFAKFINFNHNSGLLLNNDDWLSQLNYISFLRDFGRHFTINRMLSFDSVKLRLDREQPLTFLEFNYMIFQAYDFLYLHNNYDCRLELGGSDQWGNIVNGVELTRRVTGKHVMGLTTHLITTSSGAKMGKTASGAVWLNADMLPVYDYWQFWRNTEDADVIKYMKLFTDMPLDEIARYETLKGSEINEAKKALADQATTLCHGMECLSDIHSTVENLFESKTGGNLESLSSITVTNNIALIDAMVDLGLAKSKGEARRLIEGNGVRVNDKPATDTALILNCTNLENGLIKVSAGKKRHAVVRIDKSE